MLGISETMMSDKMIESYLKSKGYQGNQYRSMINMLKQAKTQGRQHLTAHQKAMIEQAKRKPHAAKKQVQKNDNLLIVDFQNMTDDELMNYGTVFSKQINQSGQETMNRIVQLKREGNKYMNSTELVDKLNAMQANNVDIKQKVGQFYKGELNNEQHSLDVMQSLEISQDGDKFLPKKMRERIVLDYPETNKLRELINVTTESDLREVAALKYKDEGVEAESITLQPIQDRVLIDVSESITYGTETNLVDTLEKAMKSALLTRELDRVFAIDPADKFKHMSVYHNDIEEVEGINIYEAVDNALEDLPQAIRNNSSIVMSLNDYKKVVLHLGEIGLGSIAANPNMIWNKQLEIIDQVDSPVIGDFDLINANYERVSFASQKDVIDGVYTFGLPFVHDIRVLLPKAFRIAKVGE